MYEIGRRIKSARESRGYSQKEFAQLIGAKNTTVSNWEKGLTRPDADTLASICRALDVSADELLDIVIEHMAVTPQEREIIIRYRNKSELQQAVRLLLGMETSDIVLGDTYE